MKIGNMMIGLGTIINTLAIICGGVIGLIFGKFLNSKIQDTLINVCGVTVLFIGIAGALEGMLTINEGKISSGKSMFIVLAITIGAVIGEIIDIDSQFERFGKWLKYKTGNAKDKLFIDGFVTASLTVCIGAMAIIGAIEDGLNGNYSILMTKAVLDFVIIMIMTVSMGKGCVFSCIPVFFLQGSVTFLAKLIKPIMTANAVASISMIGSILIFCVGLNLIWGKKVKVANLLPSIIFAVIFTYIPFFK